MPYSIQWTNFRATHQCDAFITEQACFSNSLNIFSDNEILERKKNMSVIVHNDNRLVLWIIFDVDKWHPFTLSHTHIPS
jgi:hypothetical protein